MSDEDQTPLEWRTERRRVGDLMPYEFNPRVLSREQHDQLVKSLERFNLVELPAVNTNGKIVAGHQRIRVLIELGRADEEIEVRVPNRSLTEEEFREYLIRSNKNQGDWDFDILANSFEVDDLRTWGFADSELGLQFGDEDGEGDGEGSSGPKVHKCPNCSFEFED